MSAGPLSKQCGPSYIAQVSLYWANTNYLEEIKHKNSMAPYILLQNWVNPKKKEKMLVQSFLDAAKKLDYFLKVTVIKKFFDPQLVQHNLRNNKSRFWVAESVPNFG